MSDESLEVVMLPSGVRAMRDHRCGQTMHCGTGPGVEPVEVYVVPSRLEARLEEAAHDGSDELSLFDIGLGAASNALAALRVSEARERRAPVLSITSFDNETGPLELALGDEHRAAFGFDDAPLAELARALLDTGEARTERSTWQLREGDLLEQLGREADASADIVFWDMYSPRVSAHLWTVDAFRLLHSKCRDGATVHTYAASTSVRCAMLLAGFHVGRGVATGDRGETTIAAMRLDDLSTPLGADWLGRLERSSAPFPPGMEASERARAELLATIAARPQFAK